MRQSKRQEILFGQHCRSRCALGRFQYHHNSRDCPFWEKQYIHIKSCSCKLKSSEIGSRSSKSCGRVKIDIKSVLFWLSTTWSPLTKSVREGKEWQWRQRCRWQRRRRQAWARRTRPQLTLQSRGESVSLSRWKWKFEQVKLQVWASESESLS